MRIDRDGAIHLVDLDRDQFEQARRHYVEHSPSARDTERCHACDWPWPCPAYVHGEGVLRRAGAL